MTLGRTQGKILAIRRREIERWVNDNIQDIRIRALVSEYWQHPIILYTGSGVSTGPSEPIEGKVYGLPTWIPLLQEVSKPSSTTSWPEDPWQAADTAVKLCGGEEEFKNQLEQLIGELHNYRGQGQLAGTFVSNAHTLNSVAAFCGQITGRITNPRVKNPRIIHYRTSANPRIHAVLTANYDCFLKCAASNLYRKSPLKPVTALGSLASSTSRIPVFHIHGFVPHPTYHDEEREQTIDKLIITRKDYEDHWKVDNVFGTTMGPQIHYLRYFTVLFVGFSFNDEYVRKLLCHINKEYLSHSGRTHFALLGEQEVQERDDSFFKDMGILPIEYKNYDEIPSILGQVYKAGLITDRIAEGKRPITQIELPGLFVRKHTLTKHSYCYSIDNIWKIMRSCNNESVSANIVRRYETISS